jgi:hypothetical protein
MIQPDYELWLFRGRCHVCVIVLQDPEVCLEDGALLPRQKRPLAF